MPIEDSELVDQHIDLIATQYRESPNLLGFLRVILEQLEEIRQIIAAMPDYFDLDTAVGDQLTIIGKQLGWPRCHCVCDITPVFGFACGSNPLGIEIVGFCENGTWINCHSVGSGEWCFHADDVYRRYLKARRYQMLGLYDLSSLEAAAVHIWGASARVVEAGGGQVVLTPGRLLLPSEVVELPLAFRVLPIAPGIRGYVHLGVGPVFGFGTGWSGFCATPEAEWLCPTDPHPYSCAA